jgi:RNA polymerase sigma-70 factor (ECF subfamily)
MEPDTEKEFIQACETHSDALFRYCYFKISDREIAKDLVQETFLKTWNYLVKGEKIDNIRAFFYKILGNLIIDDYRKKKAVSLDELASTTHFDPGFDEEEMLENKLDAEFTLKLLDEIPEMYKDVIIMRYVEDLSLTEISGITKESENTVAVKIHRGLKKLKELWKAKAI